MQRLLDYEGKLDKINNVTPLETSADNQITATTCARSIDKYIGKPDYFAVANVVSSKNVD